MVDSVTFPKMKNWFAFTTRVSRYLPSMVFPTINGITPTSRTYNKSIRYRDWKFWHDLPPISTSFMELTRPEKNEKIIEDREEKTRVFKLDPTEYRFKLALINLNYEVSHLTSHSKLVGESIIAYMHKKGYPELALHYVKEQKTRFALAIECAKFQIALEAAKSLDNKLCWEKLGQAALTHGNQLVVETCYQRAKNFEKLFFLYLVTGQLEKLKKMMKISEAGKDDISFRYLIALVLGDVLERVKVLKLCGQLTLACLTCVTHGLTDEAETLSKLLKSNLTNSSVNPSTCELFLPSPPLINNVSNWPLSKV